ncbi:flagellar hook-length control protein FliK [Guptibacillus spartinae]|uniref:flagellar hook-length control protein FliK n=1 Tax=Guptibacillus spartinae TaxID=3025679 RepID=UPI00235DE41A|nr:flagellar hook-length control protein FliK [Pseudalkalibacillus spartinae]
MNAIQSLGKSVIVQPKGKANSSTEFSSLLNTVEEKKNGKEAEPSAELKEETVAEQEAGVQKSSELPFHFLVMNSVVAPLENGQDDQASSQKKLPDNDENEELDKNNEPQIILPGFTKQELMKMERGGIQLPYEKITSEPYSNRQVSGQAIQEKAELQLEGVSLPGFTKQEWLKMEQALVAEVEKLVDGDGKKLVEGAKVQAPKELLATINQLIEEQSSQEKNLVKEMDQTTQPKEQVITVKDEMERPVVVEAAQEASSQSEKTEVSETLENVEQPLDVIGDEGQTNEKLDGGIPLVKQSHDVSLKEMHVQARYLNTELSEMITERMQLSKNGDETNIRIKLSPENLGQLDIRLTTLDGKVTAHIVTATAGAKDLIESQLHQLRHTLVQQGIQLDEVEVVQQSQGSQQPFMHDGRGEQGQQFQQGKQRQGRKGEYELEDNPLVTSEKEESTSGGINYAI